ncbi:hypothetical protein BU17DRAFT_84481 [Hysterangium stoloniferum]|nr:hypothetical protein BU17DRAFT_84481 [Hysterangium stoloniferum]
MVSSYCLIALLSIFSAVSAIPQTSESNGVILQCILEEKEGARCLEVVANSAPLYEACLEGAGIDAKGDLQCVKALKADDAAKKPCEECIKKFEAAS